MRLIMRVFKERREIPERKELPLPIVEEHTGTFFIGRFSLDEGTGRNFEACGRSPKELVERMKAKLAESEPGMNGQRIPQVSVTFPNRERIAKRTLAASEICYDMTVRREGLKGQDISEFFREMDQVLDSGSG